MKKAFFTLLTLAFIAVGVSVLCAETTAGDDKVNLTQVNSIAVTRAVMRLQQTELTRVSRGRLKPNPVMFPQHTIYQDMLQNHDLLLDHLTHEYQNSLVMLGNVFADYLNVAASGNGHGDTLFFRRRLVDIYNLKPEAEKSESLLELWYCIRS